MKYRLKKAQMIYTAEIDGKNYIIDTGSPSNFAKSASFAFAGFELLAHPFTNPESIERIQSKMGFEVQGLLGLKGIEGHRMTFNLREMSLDVDEPAEHLPSSIKLKRMGKRVALEVELEGENVMAAFDTASSTSYLEEKLLEGSRPIVTLSDFHPVQGEFEVEVHEAQYCIDGKRGSFRVCKAENTVNGLLAKDGLKNLVNMDIFEGSDHIELDFTKSGDPWIRF